MIFRILDLFCGAGGFSFGFEMNKNFKTLIGVDIDDNISETFKKNNKNSELIIGDIRNDDIKNQIIQKGIDKKINMVIGGPPCQGFSLKGKNLGLNDERNFLFLEFLKIVEKINPEVVVIENVKNLINSSQGYFIKEIKAKLENLGYIVNYDILNALNYNVPQNRERAIIIGSKTSFIPMPAKKKKFFTVEDAISDISYLKSGEGQFSSNYNTPPKTDYQKIMRNNSNKLFNHVATNHSKIAIRKLSLIPPEGDKSFLPKEMLGKQKFSTTWSRLIWEKPSPTIDTRFDTPSNGRNSHPYLNRAITPREAARLQSFPDRFVFYGCKSSICKQIGNAVPPYLAKSIAEQIDKVYNAEQSEIIKKYTIYQSDALTIARNEFKNLKVDAIITDPPYNISKDNNFKTMKKPRSGLYFGDWDEKFDVCSWIDEYSKKIRENGCFIIFCSYLYISYLIDRLKKNGFVVKDIIVWRKKNPMPRNVKRRYVQDMEFAIWSVREKSKWVFNKDDSKPYLRSLYETSIVSGKEKVGHPTQKSILLLREIIKVHTNENDLILDPFMGSGTTGIAALELNRKFIGVDNNKMFFEIAKKRFSKFDF